MDGFSRSSGLPGDQLTIIWVHSGGTDPDTGAPSVASRLRLDLAQEEYCQVLLTEGNRNVRVLVSGEETRKSGPGDQATKLARTIDWVDNPDDNLIVWPEALQGAYQLLSEMSWSIGKVVFVNDDAHMGDYLLEFAMTDMALRQKIVPAMVPVTALPEYVNQYPLVYMRCYKALRGLRDCWREPGLLQFFLFALDRAVNKPMKDPLRKALVWLADKGLRSDLRG